MIYTVKTIEPNFGTLQSAESADISYWKWEKSPVYPTCARLVFQKDSGFTCQMLCRQSEPWVRYQKNNDPVWLDSAMEFFVSFGPEGYINMECNAAGAHLTCFGPDREHRTDVLSLFDAKAYREKDLWSVTFTLPLDSILRLYPSQERSFFRYGYRFSGNFYKTGLDPITNVSHYGMWNEINTPTPDFHRPEQFGSFILSDR